jgi:hypothetical protein
MSENYGLNLLLVSDWTKRTETLLKSQIKKLNIGVTDELYESIKGKVIEKGMDMIQSDFSFLQEGRFVDMGVGRGRKIESQKGNGEIISGINKGARKPKKWYSKTFFGRLYALQGVMGANISEQAVGAVLNPLNSINK